MIAELNMIVRYNELFNFRVIKLIHIKHGICFGYYLTMNLWLLKVALHVYPTQLFKPRLFLYLKELKRRNK